MINIFFTYTLVWGNKKFSHTTSNVPALLFSGFLQMRVLI